MGFKIIDIISDLLKSENNETYKNDMCEIAETLLIIRNNISNIPLEKTELLKNFDKINDRKYISENKKQLHKLLNNECSNPLSDVMKLSSDIYCKIEDCKDSIQYIHNKIFNEYIRKGIILLSDYLLKNNKSNYLFKLEFYNYNIFLLIGKNVHDFNNFINDNDTELLELKNTVNELFIDLSVIEQPIMINSNILSDIYKRLNMFIENINDKNVSALFYSNRSMFDENHLISLIVNRIINRSKIAIEVYKSNEDILKSMTNDNTLIKYILDNKDSEIDNITNQIEIFEKMNGYNNE